MVVRAKNVHDYSESISFGNLSKFKLFLTNRSGYFANYSNNNRYSI